MTQAALQIYSMPFTFSLEGPVCPIVDDTLLGNGVGCMHEKNSPEYWSAFSSARHNFLKHGVLNVFIKVRWVCVGCPSRQTPHYSHLVSHPQQVPATAANSAIKRNTPCVPRMRQAPLQVAG